MVDNKYIFFDLETRFEGGKHKANFACAITGDGYEFTAEGYYCVPRFLNHFRCSKYIGHTWLDHNAAGFYNILLLEHFTNMGVTPQVIMTGCSHLYV